MSELRLFTQDGKEIAFASKVTISDDCLNVNPLPKIEKGTISFSCELKLPQELEDVSIKVNHAFGQRCGRRKRLAAYNELLSVEYKFPFPVLCFITPKAMISLIAFEKRLMNEQKQIYPEW